MLRAEHRSSMVDSCQGSGGGGHARENQSGSCAGMAPATTHDQPDSLEHSQTNGNRIPACAMA